MKFLHLSKYWFVYKHLLFVVLLSILIFVSICYGLRAFTLHNQHKVVPDLSGVPLTEVSTILRKKQLNYEVLDSTKFIPSLPPLTVINHFPKAGDEVKSNRKIYLTMNPSGYGKVTVPNIIQVTRRNAESMIRAVGFEVGEISYVDNVGKDMVLEIRHNGELIESGILLSKASKIDLVLGNGER